VINLNTRKKVFPTFDILFQKGKNGYACEQQGCTDKGACENPPEQYARIIGMA